jgi:hypothetical protein
MQIKYKTGYRHQLYEDFTLRVLVFPDQPVSHRYMYLSCNGNLLIRAGYAWDGPSGPCRWLADRMPGWIQKKYLKHILPGSLVHDVLCQLLRMGLLNQKWADQVNKEFRRINLESGMSRPRARWTYEAVNRFGAFAFDPKNKRKVLTAP